MKKIFIFIIFVIVISIFIGEVIYIHKVVTEKNIVSGYCCPVCGGQNVSTTYPLEECKLEITTRTYLICADCKTRFCIEELK